jgi:hypothetical protein
MARLNVAMWPPDHVVAVLSAFDRPTGPGVHWSRPE